MRELLALVLTVVGFTLVLVTSFARWGLTGGGLAAGMELVALGLLLGWR